MVEKIPLFQLFPLSIEKLKKYSAASKAFFIVFILVALFVLQNALRHVIATVHKLRLRCKNAEN